MLSTTSSCVRATILSLCALFATAAAFAPAATAQTSHTTSLPDDPSGGPGADTTIFNNPDGGPTYDIKVEIDSSSSDDSGEVWIETWTDTDGDGEGDTWKEVIGSRVSVTNTNDFTCVLQPEQRVRGRDVDTGPANSHACIVKCTRTIIP